MLAHMFLKRASLESWSKVILGLVKIKLKYRFPCIHAL